MASLLGEGEGEDEGEDAWIMVVDTETTGLGPEYTSPEKRKSDWDYNKEMAAEFANGRLFDVEFNNWNRSETYIAQLSYIMYNTTTNAYKIYNKFISDIPEDVVVKLLSPGRKPPANYETLSYAEQKQYTHPITLATLNKGLEEESDKTTIEDAMTEFIADFNRARVVAAHNADFDRKLIFAELARIKRKTPDDPKFEHLKQHTSKFFCTMCVAKDLVGINSRIDKTTLTRVINQKPMGTGKWVWVPALKDPALWEVYDKMFGYPPDESALHDALVDVVVCLRVFYRLWMTRPNGTPSLCGRGPPDIYNLDVDSGGEISDYIRKITPKGIFPEGNYNPDLGLGPCYTEGELYMRLPGDKIEPWNKGGNMKKTRRKKRKSRRKKYTYRRRR